MIQWNCNGVRTHFNDLKILINDHNPVCLLLQETHLRDANNFSLKGYNIYRKDVAGRARASGGVLTAVSSSIFSEEIQLTTRLQAVAVKINTNKVMSVCNIYLPPDENFTFVDLENLINQIPPPIILAGDVNSYHTRWGSRSTNGRGRLLEGIIDRFQLTLLNTGEPTYLSSSYGTFSAIDIAISSPSLFPQLTWTPLTDLYGSDHYPIIINIAFLTIPSNRKSNWIINKADWDKFSLLASAPDESPEEVDIETANTLITDRILNAAEASIPTTSETQKRPRVPWFNSECKTARKNRRRAFRIFKSNMTSENLIEFKRQRAICRRVFNQSKRESWRTFTENLNKNTPAKTIWNAIRSIEGKHSPPSFAINCGGRITNDPLLVCEEFARHYTSVFNAPYEPDFVIHKETNEQRQLDFLQEELADYNLPFTEWELDTTLKGLKGSSPGPDRVHNKMIQNLPPPTRNWLLRFYNRIWSSGQLPQIWKLAELIPIPKKDKDKRLPKSYRPVSLTSCLCKILERMVNRRLTWTLEKQNLIPSIQSGFRRNRSTLDHLVQIESEIQYAFVKNQQGIGVFFDAEAAYDRVWRHGILIKLHELGFRGHLPIFVQQFLRERRFRVRIGNTTSQAYEQTSGVPQGCVLSTTLFSVVVMCFAQPLPRPVKIFQFVDDVAIYCRGSDTAVIGRSLQEAIKRLHETAKSIGMRFSPEKSKCLHFSRKRNTPEPPALTLNGAPLPYVPSYRFLGIILDKRLTWREHIEHLRERCFTRLNLLKVLSGTKWGADRCTLLRVYKAAICAKLDYGSFIYASALTPVLTRLDTVHHAGLRLATGAFRTSPVLSLCAESGVPPLLFRRHKLSVGYASKVYLNPNNPAYPYVFQPKFAAEFRNKPQSTLPLAYRIKATIDRIKETTIENRNTHTPPWKRIRPKVNLTLTSASNKSLTPTEIQNKFNQIIRSHDSSTLIYTDGSKSDTATAYALVTAKYTYKYRLHQLCSIFTAELSAISAALHIAMSSPEKTVTVVTDSLSALHGLSNMYSQHPVINTVQEYLTMLSDLDKECCLIWAPGHVGILGNELADKAAKEALLLPLPQPAILTATDLSLPVRNDIKASWQSMWDESGPSKLKMIKKSVRPWKSSERSCRREEVILTRLRIGHTRLTHLYLISREEQPKCPYCRDPLTIPHIFNDCQTYKTRLEDFNIPLCLREALADDPLVIDNVFKFLRACSMYDSL